MFYTQKKTFKTIFLITTIALLVLPAITTFNELLTSVVMRIQVYRYIQEFIVPFQAKMITAVVNLFGITASATTTGVYLGQAKAVGNNVTISWNCIGWQSFFLFALTLATGLQGHYNLSSRLQTITIGVLGTFLMNITRISLVVLVAHYVSRQAGIIFHDYFSTLMTVAWLFFFWWFVFAFVLERDEASQEQIPSRSKILAK